MVLVENDAFLSELTKLFQSVRSNGSVSLTMKRFDGHQKPEPREGNKPLPEPTEYTCLIRAKTQKKKVGHYCPFKRCEQIPTCILQSAQRQPGWSEKAKKE